MDAGHATYGTFDDMELVKTDKQLSNDERTQVNSMVNDAMAVANQMSVEASKKRKEKKAQKEAVVSAKDDAQEKVKDAAKNNTSELAREDARFGSVADAEEAVMAAFGIKKHDKPKTHLLKGIL